MNRIILAVLAGIAISSLTAVQSHAAQVGPPITSKNPGYLVDRNGEPVKMGRTGDCIRLTRQWSQAVETPQCRTASMKANPSGR